MPARRVTSADVARAAGVSRATVSYVLNGRTDKQISEVTRHSVLLAAQDLRYQPSPAARALRRGRGNLVLAVLPGWDTANQLGMYLSATGEFLADSNLPFLRYEGGFWQGRVSQLLAEIPAACVVTLQALDAPDQQALANARVPEVGAWFLDAHNSEHVTRIRQEDVVAAQIDHLSEQGTTRFVFAYERAQRDHEFCVYRREAFRSLTTAAGRSASIVELPGAPTELGAALGLGSRSDDRVGVCCFNDITAYQLLAAARAARLPVPGRLAVVGVDDLALSSFTDPPLSTVRFDVMAEAASTAARVLTALDLPVPPRVTATLSQEEIVRVVRRGST